MSVKIGLIGAGRMGQVFAHHLAFSVAEADFVALADADEATAIGIAATRSLDEGRPVYLSELKV